MGFVRCYVSTVLITGITRAITVDFFQPSEKKNHQTFRSQETRPGCHVYRVSVGKRQDFPKAIFEDPVFLSKI